MKTLRDWLKSKLVRFPRIWAAIYLLRHGDRLTWLLENADKILESVTPQRLGYHCGAIADQEIALRKEFLRRCFHYLKFNNVPGDYVEFGCHGANTFRLAFSASQLMGCETHFWGFDSFAGLPEATTGKDAHPRWIAGAMRIGVDQFHSLCQRHRMQPRDYTVVEGFYQDTLKPEAGSRLPNQIALAYIDCDLYSSTIDVLRFLDRRLRPSMLLAFDDYYCNSPDQPSGERLATMEWFRAHPVYRLVPYQQFGWHGMSFVLEKKDSWPAGVASAW